MKANARLRLELRTSGAVSMGCRGCFLEKPCGGLPNGNLFFNCFNQFCCEGQDCDHVCPYKPEDYRRRMCEIGGLRFDDIPALYQTSAELPHYVPMVHHGYSRRDPLKAEIVALDPYMIFCIRNGKYTALTEDPTELRRHFKVAHDAKIILRGTAEDRFLERYWEYRKAEGIPSLVAKLGITLFIGPNYSHFLDVPRSDLLYNRKRQLVCLAELSEAGVSVAPNLSAIIPADWDFWSGFLKDNPQLHHIAVNFQTGYRSRCEGMKAINRVAKMQDETGRKLSLILIGGGQYVKDVAPRFTSFTLIDSQPFKQSLYRKRFAPSGDNRRWGDSRTPLGQPLDELMQKNAEDYSAWVTAHGNINTTAPLCHVSSPS